MSSSPAGLPSPEGDGAETYSVSDLTREVKTLRVSVQLVASKNRFDRFVGAAIIVLFVAFATSSAVFTSRTSDNLSAVRTVQSEQAQTAFADCQQRNAGQAGTTKLAGQTAAFLAALNAAEAGNRTAPPAVVAAREKAYITFLKEIHSDVVPAAPTDCSAFLHP